MGAGRLAGWFRRRVDPARVAADGLYGHILAQARSPAFFARFGVPDDWNGRFDCLVLHMFLVLDRLRAVGPDARQASQALIDTMFADMDRSVREAGIGDLSVGKQVKAMAAGFNGRSAAYAASLADDGQPTLAAALQRNLLGAAAAPGPAAAALARYVRAARQDLATQPPAALLAGECRFPAPEEFI